MLFTKKKMFLQELHLLQKEKKVSEVISSEWKSNIYFRIPHFLYIYETKGYGGVHAGHNPEEHFAESSRVVPNKVNWGHVFNYL